MDFEAVFAQSLIEIKKKANGCFKQGLGESAVKILPVFSTALLKEIRADISSALCLVYSRTLELQNKITRL